MKIPTVLLYQVAMFFSVMDFSAALIEKNFIAAFLWLLASVCFALVVAMEAIRNELNK